MGTVAVIKYVTGREII